MLHKPCFDLTYGFDKEVDLSDKELDEHSQEETISNNIKMDNIYRLMSALANCKNNGN